MHNTFASIVVGFTVGCFVKLFTGPIVEIPTFAQAPTPEVTFVIQEDKESVIPGIMQDDLDALLDAICEVESNCQSGAIGDNGNAIGAYQIWRIYWTDVNERSNLGGKYEDCFNKEYARQVVIEWLKIYATERRLGVVTLEKMARMHNGGPNGHKKEATKKYWDKVWDVIVRKRKEKVQRFLQHIHNAGPIPPK